MMKLRRYASVLIGASLILVGVGGNLVGENPDYTPLINTIGAIVGFVAAWGLTRRQDDPLVASDIVGFSLLACFVIYFGLIIASGGQGLVGVIGYALGGGLIYGSLVALIWFGIRGPLDETDEKAGALQRTEGKLE